MAVSFIHAADLHLDSPLRGIARYEDFPADQIRAAARQAFTQLVDVALQRAVQFMILAGDIWDGDWPDIGTGLYFAREMGRLQRAGIPVYLLRGNHDAESRITRAITLPETVHIFAAEQPQTFYCLDNTVALHGQSFSTPDVYENLARSYPDAVPNCLNIGVLHTALEGDAAHARYAPCSLQELYDKGYRYWALGHVHSFQHWTDSASETDVAFPGVLQGRHSQETGAKGALHISIDDHGAKIERVLVDVVRWHVLEVDVSDAEGFQTLVRVLGQALQQFAGNHEVMNDTRAHVLRVVLTGDSGLTGLAMLQAKELRHELLGQLAALGMERLVLEKIVNSIQPLQESQPQYGADDALIALMETLNRAGDDSDFLRHVATDLQDMVQSLPADVRQHVFESRPDRQAYLDADSLQKALPELSQTLVQLLAKA